jgi:gamma-glutamyl-gamma-aminobutyrate hydrolase PuuD
MKKIAIVPTVVERYIKQYEYCIDIRLIKFLNKTNSNVEIFIFDKKKKFDKIILAGGNDLYKFSKQKKDKIRDNINKLAIKSALRNHIPVVGICAGAQYIADFFGSDIKRKNGHNKKMHKVNLIKEKKIIKVNSYHNFSIAKLGTKLVALGYCKNDRTIEYFQHQNLNIKGIIWHPERYKKFKKFDLQLFNKN